MFLVFMRRMGLEPTQAQCSLEPESSASAYSATSARNDYINTKEQCWQILFLNFDSVDF